MLTAEIGGTPWTYDRQIPGAKGTHISTLLIAKQLNRNFLFDNIIQSNLWDI